MDTGQILLALVLPLTLAGATLYSIITKGVTGIAAVGAVTTVISYTVAQPFINLAIEPVMDISNPYTGGTAYVVQLHQHTTGSDGHETPAVAMTNYKNAGYAAASIADHEVFTADPSVAGITFIRGVERSASVPQYHLAVNWATAVNTFASDQDAITYYHNQGAFVSIAHPKWYGYDLWGYAGKITTAQMLAWTNYEAMEIYNVSGAAPGGPPYSDTLLWDAVLTAGRHVWGTAVDDKHTTFDNITSPQFNLGWVVVFASDNSSDSLKTSLFNGNFYATSGPDIFVTQNGNVITFRSTGTGTMQVIGKNGVVLASGASTASYTLKRGDMYIRGEFTRTADGKKSFSQPIYIE